MSDPLHCANVKYVRRAQTTHVSRQWWKSETQAHQLPVCAEMVPGHRNEASDSGEGLRTQNDQEQGVCRAVQLIPFSR